MHGFVDTASPPDGAATTDHRRGAPPASAPPAATPAESGDVLTVRAWWDPHLATCGFEVRSEYVERFWLGIIGPSTVLLLRRFARGLDEHPDGFRVPVVDTAKALGLGAGTGRNAPIMRTIDRACTFGLARLTAPHDVAVRSHLPELHRRQLDRLPIALQRTHQRWLEQHRRS